MRAEIRVTTARRIAGRGEYALGPGCAKTPPGPLSAGTGLTGPGGSVRVTRTATDVLLAWNADGDARWNLCHDSDVSVVGALSPASTWQVVATPSTTDAGTLWDGVLRAYVAKASDPCGSSEHD